MNYSAIVKLTDSLIQAFFLNDSDFSSHLANYAKLVPLLHFSRLKTDSARTCSSILINFSKLGKIQDLNLGSLESFPKKISVNYFGNLFLFILKKSTIKAAHFLIAMRQGERNIEKNI
ncbi:hypothetical protein BpHYR1_031613 [Brachionus plicatilis]|uniref:Uncharacterized protein n=1 Tax=Brachionus plicatilis TaxID=10195 RepID=A0A3M7SIV2_BRAPC|nr:hypothetical protein BpHYR1_031613 [Brachionus plicatilis]